MDNHGDDTIHLMAWAGIPADKSDTLFVLAKECGFDMHVGLFKTSEEARLALDAAEKSGIGMIASVHQIKDSTEKVVAQLKDHPALYGYGLKDEPETWDLRWLKQLHQKVRELDPEHPCYINFYPNWAWGVNAYAGNIDAFASQVDLTFYSFDYYPVTEVEGEIVIRPDWYRNLEEISHLSKMYDRPFWAFALALSHHLGAPSPPAFYPVPTLGHLRLQVFSDLLYGAQAIQYFTFAGVMDVRNCSKKPVFDLVQKVNSEVKAYSPVFAGCSVLGVWHSGDSIPSHTRRLETMPHRRVKSLKISGEGAVISLIEKDGETYLAVQNRDCVHSAVLEIAFAGRVRRFTTDGEMRFDGKPITLDPGDVAIFRI